MSKELTKDIEKVLGTPWIFMIQLLLLMAKHPNNCIFFPTIFNPTISMLNTSHDNFVLSWNSYTELLRLPQVLLSKDKPILQFKNLVLKCLENKHFGVFPIAIYPKPKEIGHYNILIYDKKTNTLERFEPNGSYTNKKYKPDIMDKNIQKLFAFIFKDNKEKFKYLEPSIFCPVKGPQYIEYMLREKIGITTKKGFCSLWVIAYADSRLSNPADTQQQIIKKLSSKINNKDDDLYNFMYTYIQMILKTSKLLEDPSLTTNQIEEILIKSS